jgi:hypothetical protein
MHDCNTIRRTAGSSRHVADSISKRLIRHKIYFAAVFPVARFGVRLWQPRYSRGGGAMIGIYCAGTNHLGTTCLPI